MNEIAKLDVEWGEVLWVLMGCCDSNPPQPSFAKGGS